MADYKVVYRAADEDVPWEPGCPVALTAVQVSRNTETSEAWLQVKARNVSAASVASVYADLRVEYADGSAEEMPVEYLDADIDAGGELALKPRRLPRGDVASCALTIKRVDAGDVTWASTAEPEPMPKRETLALSPRAAEQRARNLGTDKASPAATGKVRDHGDWWVCACGQVNVGRDSCWSCAFPKNGLLANEDEAALLADADKYEKELFDKAVELQDQGTVASLTEAIDKFNSLGDYQDAEERLATSKEKLSKLRGARRKRSIAIGSALALVAAVVLVVTQVVIPQQQEAARIAQEQADEEARIAQLKETFPSIQAGTTQTVEMGSYEQDGNNDNGEEPITWNVLAVEDGKALLISKDILAYEYFDIGDNNYSTSHIQEFLSQDFLETAFQNDKDRCLIIGSPFLLSSDEVVAYMPTEESRKCTPSNSVYERYGTTYGAYYWWTSSPSKKYDYKSLYCDDEGKLKDDSCNIYKGVRPAIWVQL